VPAGNGLTQVVWLICRKGRFDPSKADLRQYLICEEAEVMGEWDA
jgi:hypothetical protein